MLQLQKKPKKHGVKEKSRKTAVMLLAAAFSLSVSAITRSAFLPTMATRDLGVMPIYLLQNETNASNKRICFITAQFASSVSETDKLFDVTKTTPTLAQSPDYKFYAFSNLEDLKAPGWQVIVRDLQQYKRLITQSRWPKFQAFRDPTIQQSCDTVFYVDGIISPYDYVDEFQVEAQRITASSTQFAQRVHSDGGGAEAELQRIKRRKKDVKKNVQASLKWLRAQPDYNGTCTLWENNMFGYDIHSEAFQRAANFFWDRYSLELDSWRGT